MCRLRGDGGTLVASSPVSPARELELRAKADQVGRAAEVERIDLGVRALRLEEREQACIRHTFTPGGGSARAFLREEPAHAGPHADARVAAPVAAGLELDVLLVPGSR